MPKHPYSFYTDNGFDLVVNSEGQYNIVSLATGATVLRCATLAEVNSFGTGIEYAVTQNVDRWKRPIRETGRYEIH